MSQFRERLYAFGLLQGLAFRALRDGATVNCGGGPGPAPATASPSSERVPDLKIKRALPKGRIHFHLRHFDECLLVEAGVCRRDEMRPAQRSSEGDKRIRVAMRILQIMPHYIGDCRPGDTKQNKQVLQVLAHLAAKKGGAA